MSKILTGILHVMNEPLREVYSYVTECSYVMGFSMLRVTQKRRKCDEVILKLNFK